VKKNLLLAVSKEYTGDNSQKSASLPKESKGLSWGNLYIYMYRRDISSHV
jgi:hypothetical protein